MHFRLLLLVAFISCCAVAPAQAQERAQKAFNKAMLYAMKKKPERAIKKMQDAIKEDPAYADAYSTLGAWYFEDHRYKDAIDLFTTASKACPNGNKNFAFPLSKSLLYGGQPAAALSLLNTYMPAKGNAAWEKLKENATFAAQAMNNAWPDTVFNIGPRINTTEPELFPSISVDSQTFYYTSRLNGMDEDFYYAVPDSCGGWFTGRNMGAPLNTSSQEAAQMISADGHYLFFSRGDNRSNNGWDQGGDDLFMAYREDTSKEWSVPQSFGGTVNSPAYEGMPCLSADNRELYFVSDRPGGYGGMDIWVSRFIDGRWRLPRNLGPDINTAGDETAPFLHLDNHTLYFASNGHPGMGGSDLYICRRINDSVWSKPQNMGYPINTSADEQSIFITADGTTAFLSSDRGGVAGDFDIYYTNLPAPLRPIPIGIIKGYVYDSLSKERLNYASIYINNVRTGRPIYHFQSNRGDGSFMITLPSGTSYARETDRIGYTAINDTVLVTEGHVHDALSYNVPMLPQDYVKPIYDSAILTIHFPLNSAQLSDSDQTAIQKAIAPWLEQNGILVLVNGYTDNTGTPIINEQLSFMRAGLVTKAIVALGIDLLNIRSNGWGEANPAAPNDTEEHMSKNRRVEIIIRR